MGASASRGGTVDMYEHVMRQAAAAFAPRPDGCGCGINPRNVYKRMPVLRNQIHLLCSFRCPLPLPLGETAPAATRCNASAAKSPPRVTSSSSSSAAFRFRLPFRFQASQFQHSLIVTLLSRTSRHTRRLSVEDLSRALPRPASSPKRHTSECPIAARSRLGPPTHSQLLGLESYVRPRPRPLSALRGL